MQKQTHIVVKIDILPASLDKLKELIPRINQLVQTGEPENIVYK